MGDRGEPVTRTEHDRERDREYARKSRAARTDEEREASRAYQREYARERRTRLRELGICIECRKRMATDGQLSCETCRVHAKTLRDARAAAARTAGLCLTCCKPLCQARLGTLTSRPPSTSPSYQGHEPSLPAHTPGGLPRRDMQPPSLNRDTVERSETGSQREPTEGEPSEARLNGRHFSQMCLTLHSNPPV